MTYYNIFIEIEFLKEIRILLIEIPLYLINQYLDVIHKKKAF